MPYHHATLLGLLLILPRPIMAQQPPPGPPAKQSEYNYSPPMATVLIVLIVLFFTVGFISVYIRQFALCLGFSIGGERIGGGNRESWRRERPRGLDPTIVEAFPTFLYSHVKMHRIGKTSLECAVCLNEFADHEVLRMLPRCSHVFHPHCIGPWLASNVTCPVCRANLEIQVYDVDSLAQQLGEPSEDESESSDRVVDDHNNRDVILRVDASPENAGKTPVQEIKGVGGCIGKLPRSHSTGHSLVEDRERYTLRLPAEVRSKLVNVNLSGVVSPMVGYRARSVGCTGIAVKPDRWRFSVSPPFISKPGSAWSPKSDGATDNNSNNNNNNNNNSSVGTMSGSRSLLKSIKSPMNRVARTDDIGERSCDRLWPNRPSQELELEVK